jgi:hypothetical protein
MFAERNMDVNSGHCLGVKLMENTCLTADRVNGKWVGK